MKIKLIKEDNQQGQKLSIRMWSEKQKKVHTSFHEYLLINSVIIKIQF